jgi:hypothetical protein
MQRTPMKPTHPTLGMIVTRNCPTCGHHEIGYVDSENTFHRLKTGDMVQVLEDGMMKDFDPMASGMEPNSGTTSNPEAVLAGLVAWTPEPVKSETTLRLKYGVLVDREMVADGMSAGLYGIAYRQKLHRLISEEKYAPIPVIFARFFGAPQLATGSPLEMTEALLEELDEVRNPIELVQNWLTRKDDESLNNLIYPKSLRELCGSIVDDEQFKIELDKLTLEAFFEML